MDDMQVYIANLGKYNEGELVGAWFTFPIDFEEVKEKIGLNDEYEEYAIHDYELPFTVDEYTSIGELNRLWEMVSELPEELQSELSALLTHFSSIEELSEHQEDIIIHCFRLYPYRPKHFQDCRFRRSMELFTGSTRKNTIYEAGSGWSCYERWGIFRDPKYRRPLR